jgi:D-lactate dehydrogenase (cytochrome)/glycolate oxidase
LHRRAVTEARLRIAAPPRGDWAAALGAALGVSVQTDPDVLASYARDQTPLAPAGTPAALVRARSVDDVVTTLRFANERRIPVVTRAAGTGLAGGANAVDGCIILLVSALDKIVKIDRATRTAVVEPGVVNGALAKEALAQGLYYAPDPSSRDISTIGGNIATNAGGACCLKYGVTGDHVAALKVVLADGTTIRTGALTRKNVAGLDLTRLLVGSEGTLGVIVEATMRLLPAPRPASTLLAFFGTLGDAAAAIVAMDALSELSLLEVMDNVTLRAVEELTHMDLDTSAAAMLLVQSDAPEAPAAIARCDALCRDHGATSLLSTDDPDEGLLLLRARRMALPALERKGTTLLDDVAVPKPAIPQMMDTIRLVGERHGVMIGTFGHAGDGNLHPTIVFEQSDAASTARARAAFDAIVRGAIALGGTITGEHGIGTLKHGYLEAMVGEAEQALMRRIKASFDPNGILNPGKGL